MDQWLLSTSSPLEVLAHNTSDVFETCEKSENKIKSLEEVYCTRESLLSSFVWLCKQEKGNEQTDFFLFIFKTKTKKKKVIIAVTNK
jgi:hypothetical protein